MATRDSTRDLDQLAADVDQVMKFRELYLALEPDAQKYVELAVHALANDHDGSVLELLQRHERGERVAEVYLDAATGEHVRIPEGEPIPRRHFPILEALA